MYHSEDYKMSAVNYYLKIRSYNRVCDVFECKKSSLIRWVQQYKELKTVKKIDEYKGELRKYYIPCKARVYLDVIDEKKCITILRQFIKTHGYTLVSCDKSINGNKIKLYRLIEIDNSKQLKKSPSQGEILVSFD